LEGEPRTVRSEQELDSFDPKIGLLWTPTGRLFVRASAGTSFTVPGEVQIFGTSLGAIGAGIMINGENVDARAITRGTRNLEPEEADNFTAGITWDVTDMFSFDLNYWSIDFENLVVAEDSQVI
jgi:outer membrane receptor protein involved in Fe transport